MKTKANSWPKVSKSGENYINAVGNKGFALISTVLIMSLLLVLSIAMLSYSSIVTSSSKLSKHQQAAQANARLAMMIAIGKLQQYAGQDQRVTFTASVFDSIPETEEIDGVAHPHWVGVAHTNRWIENGETKIGIIHDEDNGLVDRRSSVSDDDNRENQVLSWLVSGENLSPRSEIGADERVLLFSTGQEDEDGNSIGDVFAKKVTIKGDGIDGSYAYWVSDESVKVKYSTLNPRKGLVPNLTETNTMHGLLASQQYNLGEVFPEIGNLDPETVEKLYSNNQLEIKGLGLGLIGGEDSIRRQIRALGHDVTSYGKSLFTDSLNGGLKKNLTAYLDSNDVVEGEFLVDSLGAMPGIKNTDGILLNSNRETIGPKFGSLRDWYKLKDEVTGDLGSRVLASRLPNCRLANDSGVDPTNFIAQPIHPVLTSAYIYKHLSHDKLTLEAVEMLYPRVIMWNPYNVKISAGEMFVVMDFQSSNSAFYQPFGSESGLLTGTDFSGGQNQEQKIIYYIPPTDYEPGQTLTFTAATPSATPTTDPYYNGKGRMAIPNKGKSNPLSCEVDPADLNYYLRNEFINTNTDYAVKKLKLDENMVTQEAGILEYLPVIATEYKNALPTQTVNVYGSSKGWKGLASADPTFAELGNEDFPKIQRFELDAFHRFFPFDFGGREKIHSAEDITYYGLMDDVLGFMLWQGRMDLQDFSDLNMEPSSVSTLGFRFKHFYENEHNRVVKPDGSNAFIEQQPWYYAPIIHSNVRAGRSHRWPSDNMFSVDRPKWGNGAFVPEKHGLITYGPFAREVTDGKEPWASFNAALDDDGRYNSLPFSRNKEGVGDGSDRSILFDIPDRRFPITSLACLQHVQLTPYIWDPSYIIGTGYANPNPMSVDYTGGGNVSKLENRSAPTIFNEGRLWAKIKDFNPTASQQHGNDDVHLRSDRGDYGNPLVYDIAYETNHSLWDKYFVTGLTDGLNGWKNGKWDGENHYFPNPRLQINDSIQDSDDKVKLLDYHRAAQALYNEGALNTNSTSVIAWKAILGAFNGLNHPSRNGDPVAVGVPQESPFSRMLVPENPGSAEVADDVHDNNLWSSYRKLTDDEIDRLAREIVVQVKKRAPFIGLGDFVNRRLGEISEDEDNSELIVFGALQAAINRSLLNEGLDASDPVQHVVPFTLPTPSEAVDFTYGYTDQPAEEVVPMIYDTFSYKVGSGDEEYAISQGAAASGYMTQADVLQKIGANLTVRGDTFVIRTYGESRDRSGVIKARAWAEVVVQRSVDPITPDEDQAFLNPVDEPNSFGRKIKVVSFRWLNDKEVEGSPVE